MLYIGADHNGFWLKEELKTYLQRRKIVCIDIGAHKHKKTDDYPDYARKLGKKMRSIDRAILICGSGHGMVVAANKLRGIRASIITSVYSARKGREDDHLNVAVLSAWETNIEKAKRVIAAWLKAKPSNAQRHTRRLEKVKRLER